MKSTEYLNLPPFDKKSIGEVGDMFRPDSQRQVKDGSIVTVYEIVSVTKSGRTKNYEFALKYMTLGGE